MKAGSILYSISNELLSDDYLDEEVELSWVIGCSNDLFCSKTPGKSFRPIQNTLLTSENRYKETREQPGYLEMGNHYLVSGFLADFDLGSPESAPPFLLLPPASLSSPPCFFSYSSISSCAIRICQDGETNVWFAGRPLTWHSRLPIGSHVLSSGSSHPFHFTRYSALPEGKLHEITWTNPSSLPFRSRLLTMVSTSYSSASDMINSLFLWNTTQVLMLLVWTLQPRPSNTVVAVAASRSWRQGAVWRKTAEKPASQCSKVPSPTRVAPDTMIPKTLCHTSPTSAKVYQDQAEIVFSGYVYFYVSIFTAMISTKAHSLEKHMLLHLLQHCAGPQHRQYISQIL